MSERLTDERLDALEAARELPGDWCEHEEYDRDRWFDAFGREVYEPLRALLTEVRERRAIDRENEEALAELVDTKQMSEEECNAELKEAGVDVTLWASSTMALVKACKERNEAVARIATLEASLRECIDEENGLFMLGDLARVNLSLEGEKPNEDGEDWRTFVTRGNDIRARARAALKGGGA